MRRLHRHLLPLAVTSALFVSTSAARATERHFAFTYETGVLAPIAEASALTENAGVLFHTDAVQAGGKIPISLRDGHVHYLALAGHNIHAPKGVGVLFVNHRVAFQPWVLGGGQENNRRAGTENVAGIVALGAAAELARLGPRPGARKGDYEARGALLARRSAGTAASAPVVSREC